MNSYSGKMILLLEIQSLSFLPSLMSGRRDLLSLILEIKVGILNNRVIGHRYVTLENKIKNREDK